MDRIRVFLTDDHETVRQGLRLLIETQPDMEVVGEAADGRSAIERVRELRPAVVVLDVSMPEMNGLAAARAMREETPDLPIVALTRYRDDSYVQDMLGAGALAYVLKQSPSQELLEAIRAASRGKPYVDARLTSGLGTTVQRHKVQAGPRVSRRESEVLRLMALGYSNKEIANQLDVSVKTVEVHKANATRKLNLHGRIDIVRYAVLQGWLNEP